MSREARIDKQKNKYKLKLNIGEVFFRKEVFIELL